MATWITHLMIADRVLKNVPGLDRHSFCVGNIAPDCNVENEDWTQFVPSREITHWMSADRKVVTDCDRFYREYIENRKDKIVSEQESTRRMEWQYGKWSLYFFGFRSCTNKTLGNMFLL